MMKHLVRFACLAILILGLALTSSAADKTLKVLQKFTHESMIGYNGNISFADVNGDGSKDIVARYKKNQKAYVGIWLWRGTKFSDSVDCFINLGYVVEPNVETGDLNNDGMADLAILSQYSLSHPPKIIFGRATWPDTILTPDLKCQAVIDTAFEAQGQYSSMAIGDFNDDGFGDVCYQIQGNDVTGDYAGLYGSMLAVYFGGAAMDSVADFVYKGGHSYRIGGTGNTIIPRYFSPWHMDVGDFNGDGKMDLLTSGWNAYSSINTYNFKGAMQSMYNCGSGLIFLGGSNFATSNRPDVILMASDNWLRYTTPTQYLWLGYSVYNAGDVNGDGLQDISLPGWYMDIALIFKGNNLWTKATSDTTVLVVRDELASYTKNRFDFSAYADQHGVNLSSIGDVNGDGLDDLASTRNFFGGYAAEERGIRLFFSNAGRTGPVTPDYESSEYVQVMPGSVDFDHDGMQEFLAFDVDQQLSVLKVNPVSITSAVDVPFDQGGNIRLSFLASVDNDVVSTPYFSIWEAAPMDAVGSALQGSPALLTKDFKGKASMPASTLGGSFRWEWMKNVPAQLMANYAVSVPTLYDSSEATNGRHYFMVIAHTDDPNVFFTSEIDSGFSVDNLAPAKVSGLAASVVDSKVQLRWAANPEPDLKQYVIYKSTTANIGDEAPVYATTTGTSYSDPVALGTAPAYYVIRAQDVHGNLGTKSNEIAATITGVEMTDYSVPTAYALRQNYPNPFNPTTTIEYALKQAGNVTIRVMNLLGQEVATIESGMRAAGTYKVVFDASSLPSGMYLYQIRSGNFVDVRRMMLLK